MSFPERLNATSISTAISTLQNANICTGNYGQHFIDLALKKKGKFVSAIGELVAVLETTAYSVVNGKEIFMTVRHLQCELLLIDELFIRSFCKEYCSTLRALVSKLHHSSYTSVYVNKRFLRTPHKMFRSNAQKKSLYLKNRQLKRLRVRLNKVASQSACVPIDGALLTLRKL